MKSLVLISLAWFSAANAAPVVVEPPIPHGPTPSERQLAWHDLEFYGFIHFTVNTFTDREWGLGDESAALFNPSQLDTGQWAHLAREAGMTGLILTAKHHDGFCLWPTAETEHCVRNSPWRNGRGDVVGELAEACRREGLKLGLYLSPWDRNHPDYGRPEYITYYRRQLRELLTRYGAVFEVWFDGANGGDGYYGGARETRRIDRRTYYDWETTWELVRDLQPGACMFSDAGPDVRWVGNERGIAGDPCWATLNRADFSPGMADTARLNRGDRPGTHWLPAECDVSIRPGWFYHTKEDGQVKTPAQLIDIYYGSVGRGGSLLLNVPPDPRGLIHESDAASLLEFGRLLRLTFGHDLARSAHVGASNTRGGAQEYAARLVLDGRRDTYWAADDEVLKAELVLEWGGPVEFNVVGLREFLPLGQRVEAFCLDTWNGHEWVEFASGSSIGNRRLWRGSRMTTNRLRLRIVSAAAPPALSELSVHLEPGAAR